MGINKRKNKRKFKKYQKAFALFLALSLAANTTLPAAFANENDTSEVVLETTVPEIEVEESTLVQDEALPEVEVTESELEEATQELEVIESEEALPEQEVEEIEPLELESEGTELEDLVEEVVEELEESQVASTVEKEETAPTSSEVRGVESQAVESRINSVTVTPSITYGGEIYTEGSVVTVDNMDRLYLRIEVAGLVSGGQIQIKIPTGLQLALAPGIASVSSTSFTAKDYSVSEGVLFGANKPVWVPDAAARITATNGTMYPLSGLLTYDFSTTTGSGVILAELSVNSLYVNTTIDELTEAIKDIDINVETYNATRKADAQIGVELVGKASEVVFTSTSVLEDVSTIVNSVHGSINSNLLQASLAYEYTDTVNFSYSIQKNVPITGYSSTDVIYGVSMVLEVPTGAVVSGTSTHNATYLETVGAIDKYFVQATAKSTNLSTNATTGKASVTFSNALKVQLPKEQFAVGTYALNATELTVGVRAYDESTNVVGVYSAETKNAARTQNISVVNPISSTGYIPRWYNASMETDNEEFNFNADTDEKPEVLLYTAERSYGSNRTYNPVTFEFHNNPTDGKFQDTVSRVVMAIPLLGHDGYYSAKIKSVTVKYEGKTAVKTVADGDGYAPADNGNTNSQAGTFAGAAYAWTSSSKLSSLTFEAPEGDSIESIIIEMTGDNFTGNSGGTKACYVYGRPKSEDATDDYSNYYFKTTLYDLDGNVLKTASSAELGFKWKAPEAFKLEAVGGNVEVNGNKEYSYNTASNNVYNPSSISNINYNPRGYLEMGGFAFINNTNGNMDSGDIIQMDIQMDTDVNVVKRVILPINRTAATYATSKDNIKSIEWTYLGENTIYTYNRDKGDVSPIALLTQNMAGESRSNGSIGYMDAPEGKEFATMLITYDNWEPDDYSVQLRLKGYLNNHDVSLRTAVHTVTTKVLSENEDGTYTEKLDTIVEVSNGKSWTESTASFLNMSILGTKSMNIGSVGTGSVDTNVLKVGEVSQVTFQVSGGNASNYTTTSIRDITMDIILPAGMTLESLKAREYTIVGLNNSQLNSAMKRETVSGVTIEEFDMSKSEAVAHFGDSSVTGATRYRITLDDEFIRLYFIYYNAGSTSYSNTGITFDMEVSTTHEVNCMAIPWKDILTVGSGSKAMKSIGLGGSGNGKNHGQVVANSTGDSRIGDSNYVISGPSNVYMFVESVPAVMITNSHVEFDGDKYTYRKTDAADHENQTLAILGEYDEFSLNYSIVNNIIEGTVADRTSYVFLPIPTLANASLVEEIEFDVELVDNNGIEIVALGDSKASFTVQYINLSGSTINVNQAENYYNDGSATYDAATHNAIAIKVENQNMGETGNVTMNMKVTDGAPITDMDEYLYIEIQGEAVFDYEFGTTSYSSGYSDSDNSDYFGNNPIRFAYHSPTWDVEAHAMLEYNGTIEALDESVPVTFKVRDNYGVYEPGTSITLGEEERMFVLPQTEDMHIKGYDFVGFDNAGWYMDESLTTELVTIQDGSDAHTQFSTKAEVYAKYVAHDIKFSYDFGELKDVVENVPLAPKSTVTWKEKGLPVAAIKVPGKELVAWHPVVDGITDTSVTITSDTQVNEFYENVYGAPDQGVYKEIVLTPVFKDLEYTITYQYVMPEKAPDQADVVRATTATWNEDGLLDSSVSPENLGDEKSAYYIFEANEAGDKKGNGWYADKECTIPVTEDTIFNTLARNDSVEGITIYLKYNQVNNAVNYFVTSYEGAPSFNQRTNILLQATNLFPLGTDGEPTEYFDANRRYGYEFLGWFTAVQLLQSSPSRVIDENEYQTLVTQEGDELLSLYTKFEANKYKVNYEMGDYPEVASMENVYWSTSNILPVAPEVKGKTFKGWFTQADGQGIQVDEAYTDDVLNEDGELVEETFKKSYEYGALVLAMYNNTPIVVMPEEENGGAITLYPLYEDIKYSVSFVSEATEVKLEEDVLWTKDVYELVPATTPTQKGGTFSHWEYLLVGTGNVELESGTTYAEMVLYNDMQEDIVLYAVFTANHYEVHFNLGEYGGDVEAPTSLTEVEWNHTELIVEAPDVPGYTFTHWYKEDTLTNSVDKFTTYGVIANDNDVQESVTLYAKYVPKEYYINYDLNYSGAPEVEAFKDFIVWTETELLVDEVTEVERPGYILSGWYTNAQCSEDAKVEIGTDSYGDIADNASDNGLTLYAKYTAKEYTLTQDYGNEEELVTEGIIWDETDLAPDTAKEGYTFGGWIYEGTEGPVLVSQGTTLKDLYDAGIITTDEFENLTLTASFSLIINITAVADLLLDATDGSGTATPQEKYGITSYTVEDLIVEEVEIVNADDWNLVDIDDSTQLASNELFVEFNDVLLNVGSNQLPIQDEDNAWVIEAGQGSFFPVEVLAKYSTTDTPTGKVKLFNAKYKITAKN